ncbi:hypothetical protein C8Q76DRAFT_726589 [Earliella scabrosa]|nr:hypothetical protein C8Q76DRAFT_726589 [Earliella scabrosa]
MKDGTIYFYILMITYIVSVALGEIFEYTDMMISFITAFSTIIMARFMLELREVDARHAAVDTITVPLQNIAFGHTAVDLNTYDCDCERSISMPGSTTKASSRSNRSMEGKRIPLSPMGSSPSLKFAPHFVEEP